MALIGEERSEFEGVEVIREGNDISVRAIRDTAPPAPAEQKEAYADQA